MVQIEDKYHGGRTRLHGSRSQQLINKTTKKSGSFSVESFAAKWSIQVIDHKEILHCCNTDLHREDMNVGHTKKELQVPFIRWKMKVENIDQNLLNLSVFRLWTP